MVTFVVGVKSKMREGMCSLTLLARSPYDAECCLVWKVCPTYLSSPMLVGSEKDSLFRELVVYHSVINASCLEDETEGT